MYDLKNQVVINGRDIWTEYGAFLVEEKRGGLENLTAILAPSKAKEHVGVNIREEDGTKYSSELDVKNEERDVTLHFAVYATSRSAWMTRYREFISFLKRGDKGWLTVEFPAINITLRMFYMTNTNFKPLTCLWVDGGEVQASRFKVTFREPVPTF